MNREGFRYDLTGVWWCGKQGILCDWFGKTYLAFSAWFWVLGTKKIGKLAFIKSWADYHTGWGQGSVATDSLVTVFVYSVSHMKDLSPSHNFLETRNFLEVLVQIVSWESTVIATQELPPGRCITLNDGKKGGCDYTENYLWEHNSSYFLKNIFNVLLFLNLNFTWIHCSKVEIK